MDAKERLTELETKLTFQEATSDSLSEVIVSLEARLEAMEKRLRLVEARGSGTGEGEESDPPMPTEPDTPVAVDEDGRLGRWRP